MELLETINWAIVAPILVIQLILMVIAFVDLVRAENTNGPKWLWVVLILFANILGSILYFVIGRRNQ